MEGGRQADGMAAACTWACFYNLTHCKYQDILECIHIQHSRLGAFQKILSSVNQCVEALFEGLLDLQDDVTYKTDTLILFRTSSSAGVVVCT